jgi:hypothetical protein
MMPCAVASCQAKFNIMFNDAKSVRLGDCVVLHGGYPFRGPVEHHPEGDVAVVQMKDLDQELGVNWAGASRTFLPGRKTPEWLQGGDVLFVARGNRFFASALGPPPQQAVCGAHLFHLRVEPAQRLLPNFLAWQINQPPVQRQLAAAAEGSSQLSIRRAEIESITIALPTTDQQSQIIALAEGAQQERVLLGRLIANRAEELAGIAHALAQAAAIHS